MVERGERRKGMVDSQNNVRKWEVQDYELENLTPLKALRIVVECFYVAQGG